MRGARERTTHPLGDMVMLPCLHSRPQRIFKGLVRSARQTFSFWAGGWEMDTPHSWMPPGHIMVQMGSGTFYVSITMSLGEMLIAVLLFLILVTMVARWAWEAWWS